jgi:ABC-2 type transport system permease protein
LRIFAIARKETIHIFRDWRSLVMALFAPVFLLVLFGNALTLDVQQVPMIVWDQSNTPQSTELISKFGASKYFSNKGFVLNYRDLEVALDRSEAVFALVIPADFAKQKVRKEPIAIQMIFDGSDSNTATIALGYAEQVLAQYTSGILKKELSYIGKKIPEKPIDLQTRIWFNGNADSTYSVIPGLIAVIMMVNSALLTSMTIAREWERGTMEQLITTPVGVFELYAGKMLPYFIIGLFDVLLVVFIGASVFNVPLRGGLLFLILMGIVFLIGSLSLGLLISIVAKTQLVASQMAMVATFLPSILLSGFLSSVSNLPQVIQVLSYTVPARYFVTLLRDIYLKGTGWKTTWDEVVFLCFFALLMVVLCNLKFKKKLV